MGSLGLMTWLLVLGCGRGGIVVDDVGAQGGGVDNGTDYVVVVVVAATGAALWLRVVAVARWVLIVWALFRCKVVESCWIAWW